MNITVNIPNSNTVITIEGTQGELEDIITMLLQASKPLNTKTPAVTTKKSSASSTPSSVNSDVLNAEAFIASLYLYSSNPDNFHGRARYAAEMLIDGKPHTMMQMITESKVSYSSALRMIKRLLDAGANIIVDNTPTNTMHHTYTLVSVPSKKYRARKRSYAKDPVKKIVKTSADYSATSILRGIKV